MTTSAFWVLAAQAVAFGAGVIVGVLVGRRAR